MDGAERIYKDLVWQDQERMSGVPCFFGTRVPVAYLWEFIERQAGIDQFLDSFPSVTRSQVEGVLHLAQDQISALLVA